MTDTMAALFTAGTTPEDGARTSALLAASGRLVGSEPTVITYSLSAYREARRRHQEYRAVIAEGAPLYVSDAVRKADGGEQFIAVIQQQNPGLSVRWLSPRGWWPGWDAEPDAPPATPGQDPADLLEIHRLQREVEHWQAMHRDARAEADRLALYDSPGMRALVRSAWAATSLDPFPETDGVDLLRLAGLLDVEVSNARGETERLRRQLTIVIEERGAARAALAESQVERDVFRAEVEEQTRRAEKAESSRTSTEVAAAAPRSEYRPWIYVRGAGWWSGPWLLDDAFATDDAGTVVPLTEVSATSAVDLTSGRQLPGPNR